MFKSILSGVVSCIPLVLLCALPLHHARAQTAIIENGAAKATIFINAKAPDSVVRAAGDLQSYLKQISDVTVPVVTDKVKVKGFGIYLGDTEVARGQGIQSDKLPDDGFRIVADRNWMVIAGKDYDGPPLIGFQDPYTLEQVYNKDLKLGMFGDTGTMFGVNHFLEKYCGVRWYAPGELGTVIPRTSKVVVPVIDLTKAPYFPQRHAFYAYMDWFPEDMLWYRRAGFGSPVPVQITHSFTHLFSKYKETHPEYFAVIGGKPDFTNLSTEEGHGNLNLAHPGFIQQVIDDANKFFDENPGQDIYPLCPPDGMTKISEDPVSQAQIDETNGPGGKFSNYVWGFINTVAKGIQKKHPDKFIGGFAYERYSFPPTNIDKLEDNVVLVLTKFRAQYPNPVIKKRTDDRIAMWSKKVKTIYGWEYYCNPLYNRAWRGFPMSFPKLVQEDLQALKGISKGEFIEAETWANSNPGRERDDIRLKFRGLDSLLLYTTARLLWEPDMNREAMLTEYYKLFYGPGEVPMRGFWESVESNWLKKGWQMSPYEVYDSAIITRLLNYLNEAQAKTAADSIYRKRIDLMLKEFTPAAQVALKQQDLPRPTADVPALRTAPVLAEGEALPPLLNAPPLQPFLDRYFNTASPVTNVQVAWDQKNLYVDLRCYEPHMDKLKMLAKERDSSMPGVYDDDCVELFLSPNVAEPEKTFHYVVNAGGALFDARINQVNTPEIVTWNGNAKVVVRREATRWIARLAIPWSDLGVQNPQTGHKLAANFVRTRHAAGQDSESGWAPVRHTAYYTPQDFGVIVLQGPSPAPQVVPIPTTIVPATKKDYGSGASTVDAWYDGGVPDVGLFVGQANPYVRNDRALARFDLTSLLEAGERIGKVELTFGIHSLYGKTPERDLSVRYFVGPVAVLDVQSLGTGAVEPLAIFRVKPEMTFENAAKEKSAFVRQKVDVTEQVKAAIAKGQTSITFRWQDEQAEKTGNPDGEKLGMLLSGEDTGGLPSLDIEPRAELPAPL